MMNLEGCGRKNHGLFQALSQPVLAKTDTTIKVLCFDKQPLGQESRKSFPDTKQEF